MGRKRANARRRSSGRSADHASITDARAVRASSGGAYAATTKATTTPTILVSVLGSGMRIPKPPPPPVIEGPFGSLTGRALGLPTTPVGPVPPEGSLQRLSRRQMFEPLTPLGIGS